MKICLIIRGLPGGGAERLLVNLSQEFVDKGHQVIVLTFDEGDADFYRLPDAVQRIRLSRDQPSATVFEGLKQNLVRITHMTAALKALRPDCCISFLSRSNVLATIACSRAGDIPCIVSEHSTSLERSKLWRTLMHAAYPHASKLVSVSEGLDELFLWLPKAKRTVIPNLITVPGKLCSKAGDPQRIVTLGRLCEEKNQALLLDAFADIADEFKNATLDIIGDGPLRPELEERIKVLQLEKRVALHGALSEPFSELRRCGLFVLSSKAEGFGNVLVEAMACGLPVISTDCPSGPSEILEGGAGLLVPSGDRDALAEAMRTMLTQHNLRETIRQKGVARAKEFSAERIVPQWERLILDVCAGR